MIRMIFVTIMVLHGLLHLIGFAKEWNLGSQGQLAGRKLIHLSQSSSRIAGTLWLAASILFITAVLLFLAHTDRYWIPAVAALLISQTLIIVYWQDARYGTFVNLIILFAIIFAAAATHFNSTVRRDIERLEARAVTPSIHITEEMLARLPLNVQRWLRQANVVGAQNPNVIRIIQRGNLRSKPDGKWMPFQAVQYFSIDPPAFVWQAKIQAGRVVRIAARDKFEDGRGYMLIKPMYVFTAANSTGTEVNQGTLQRYLAEMAWFPQAAVSPSLKWESLNDHQARVTMEVGGTSASGIYTFDEAGNVKGFEAYRYGDFDGTYRKEIWSIKVTGYKTFHNRLIGNASEVTWKLKEGDFTWFTLEVTDIN